MPRGIPRDKSVKRKILHHLKITKGHLDKVISMVEADEYCIDVIHQSLAVQFALKNVDREILENHLKTCVSESIKKGDSKEVIGEIMKVLDKK
jgi:DNA-binding FrmR family transcriptional regulator